MRTMRTALTTTLLALAGAVTGLLAGPVMPAGASYGEVTSFGAGKVHEPVGVAVDAASGDVYVGNFFVEGHGPLDRFDAAGNLLAPSPFGKGEEFFGAHFSSGVAVDPANGELDAVDAVGQALQRYDTESGALLSHFSVAGSANVFGLLTVVQIAEDTGGHVYFPNTPNNEVQEFDSEGNVLHTFTGSGAEVLKEPTGVAVDAYGNVYVADDGNGRLEEFTPAGAFVMAIGTGVDETTKGDVCTAASGDTCGPGSDGTQSVALGAGGEILLGEKSGAKFHVVVYSPTGELLDDFGLGTLGSAALGALNTLAVGPNGAVYVTDGANNLIRVYAEQRPPALQSASATLVEHFSATIKGAVEAGLADTAYRIEYGPSETYGASTAPAGLGLGLDGPVSFSQQLTGLAPGTTYHYRIAASNALGQTVGPDETFTTLPPAPPVVATGVATGVAQNAATLSGTIDTGGFETTYEFDIGVDTGYGTRIFGDAGVEAGPNPYSFALQGLMPGTTYHYRIAATNRFGTTYGVDRTFTTALHPTSVLAEPEVPPLLATQLLAPAGAAPKGSAAATADAKASARRSEPGRRNGRRKSWNARHRHSSQPHNANGRGK